MQIKDIKWISSILVRRDVTKTGTGTGEWARGTGKMKKWEQNLFWMLALLETS